MYETHHDRVSLPDEDGEGIDGERLTVHTVNFDDSHIMTINGECVVGIAGKVDYTEAIANEKEGI